MLLSVMSLIFCLIVGICTQEEEGGTQNCNCWWQEASEFIKEVGCQQHCWNWGGKSVFRIRKLNVELSHVFIIYVALTLTTPPLRWTWSRMTGLWSTSTTPKFRPLCPPTRLPSPATLRPNSWRRCFPAFLASWEQTASAACANWRNSSLGKVGAVTFNNHCKRGGWGVLV